MMDGSKYSLIGKRALITGGSKGIGLGIAVEMARSGADIAIVGRDSNTLKLAKNVIEAKNVNVSTYSFDMTAVDEIQSLYRNVRKDGVVDILIINAGGTRRGSAETITSADWGTIINLNLNSVFHLCQLFGRDQIEKISEGNNEGRGKIVNIASVLSEQVREHNAPYAASKGAIRQLTKSLAVDWAKYKINVNAIGPGFIKTDLTKSLWKNENFDRWVRKRTPLAEWGTAEAIGDTAVFLSSPCADYITGQTIYVDGGLLSSL